MLMASNGLFVDDLHIETRRFSIAVKLEVESSATPLESQNFSLVSPPFWLLYPPKKPSGHRPLGDLGIGQQLLLLSQELRQRQRAAPDQTTWEGDGVTQSGGQLPRSPIRNAKGPSLDLYDSRYMIWVVWLAVRDSRL